MNSTMRYCAGCLTELKGEGGCPSPTCHWDERTENVLHDDLPRHYLLNGRVYIGKVLGQGGFGVTYLARDTELNRLVAIKEYLPRESCSRLTDRVTVRPHAGDKAERFDSGLQRFLEEAQKLAQLEGHPNIVSITDYLKANGTAYMVMRFIPGVTLKQYLAEKGGRIPYPTARQIMLHVMSALRRAHQDRVTHRDISPDNIMLSSEGQVKVIDFGAARQATSVQAAKNAGMTVILKPGYAPEEQYRSNGHQGPWTDVYAVTATLYRCVTGVVPPAAPDRAEEELVPASRLCSDLPKEMDAVIARGMAMKMVDRYQSIEELQKAVLEPSGVERPGEKSSIRPPELIDSREADQQKIAGAAWIKRPLAYVALAVLLAAGVLGGALYLRAGPHSSSTAPMKPAIVNPETPPAETSPAVTTRQKSNPTVSADPPKPRKLKPAIRASDEAVGDYTFCSDSPDPARCRAYKARESLKDGSTH